MRTSAYARTSRLREQHQPRSPRWLRLAGDKKGQDRVRTEAGARRDGNGPYRVRTLTGRRVQRPSPGMGPIVTVPRARGTVCPTAAGSRRGDGETGGDTVAFSRSQVRVSAPNTRALERRVGHRPGPESNLRGHYLVQHPETRRGRAPSYEVSASAGSGRPPTDHGRTEPS